MFLFVLRIGLGELWSDRVFGKQVRRNANGQVQTQSGQAVARWVKGLCTSDVVVEPHNPSSSSPFPPLPLTLSHTQAAFRVHLRDGVFSLQFALRVCLEVDSWGVTLLEQEAKTTHGASKMAIGFSQWELFFELYMAARYGGHHFAQFHPIREVLWIANGFPLWRPPFSRQLTAKHQFASDACSWTRPRYGPFSGTAPLL